MNCRLENRRIRGRLAALVAGLAVLLCPLLVRGEKPKPVNLLSLPQARIADSSLGRASAPRLRRIADGRNSTCVVISGRSLEVTYSFAGKTVSPQAIEVLLATGAADNKPVGAVEIMASCLSQGGGFQSLRSDVLKNSPKPQRFGFTPVGAARILVRITPLRKTRRLSVAEVRIWGRNGAPETQYRFKESPAKAFAVLAQLPKTVKVAVSADEARLFRDARDGRLDRFSFAEATLLASGVTDARKRRAYLRQISVLEAEARKALANAKTPTRRGDALLKWLHAGPLKGGYRSHQTRVSTVLSDKTYNCVSSAAVYNVLGRRLGLDLRAIEVPDHAFSILYVGRLHYDVETTTKNGFAPARNPAVLKELQQKKGFRYIPERNRDKRREIGELGLAAIIYYNRGVSLMKQKQHNAALVAYFCALSLDPEFASAVKNSLAVLTNWSNALAKAGKYDQALRVIKAGLKLAPKDANLNHNHKVHWTNWALSAIDSGNHDRALRILRNADAAIPGGKFGSMRSRVFIRPGEKLVKLGKWADAIALADLGLKKIDGAAADDLKRYRNGLCIRWGNVELRKRRYDKAAQALEQGYAAAPNDKKIINNLGYLAREWTMSVCKRQGLEQGFAVARNLQKRFSRLKGVQTTLANTVKRAVYEYRRTGKYEEALNAIRKGGSLLGAAKQRNEVRAGVYDAWARSFWQKKQYDRGLKIYRRGLKQLPGNALLARNAGYVWNLKGMAAIKAKDWETAIADYTAALKEFPNNRTLKSNLRYCRQQKQRAAG